MGTIWPTADNPVASSVGIFSATSAFSLPQRLQKTGEDLGIQLFLPNDSLEQPMGYLNCILIFILIFYLFFHVASISRHLGLILGYFRA